jgi:NAD(P)-dependent dehydrogenase (short-subunit alcohol dehydrogenase family)
MGALDAKIAVVTGGTSGIGEGIAKAFVLEGAKVVIAGRRDDEGRAIEKETGVRFVRADVAIEADARAMIDKTVEWFGRVDCLVNNAGIPLPMTTITEIDVATIDQVLAVNVRRVGVCKRPGHCGRRRDDERHPRLVGDCGRACGNGEAHQGGGRGIVISPSPLRGPSERSELRNGNSIRHCDSARFPPHEPDEP